MLIAEATPKAFILARTQKDASRLMSVFEAGLFLIKKTNVKERKKAAKNRSRGKNARTECDYAPAVQSSKHENVGRLRSE